MGKYSPLTFDVRDVRGAWLRRRVAGQCDVRYAGDPNEEGEAVLTHRAGAADLNRYAPALSAVKVLMLSQMDLSGRLSGPHGRCASECAPG
jgi:hypothetical protein